MAGKYRIYSPEFKEEAVRLVIESSRPIADVARELQITETSLGNWVRAWRESMQRMSRRFRRLNGPGCASWNGSTASWRWKMRS